MYLEFVKFSYMSMANSSMSDSNQLLSSVCSSIPTMEFSASRKEMDEKKQEVESEYSNNQRESYSSCSSSSSFMSLQVEQEVATKHDHNHEDDTGYQTPTSPRHRIPTTLKCPPAPKKPPATLRAKRKARRGPLARHEIKVFLIQEPVDFEPRRKKARRDTTIG